MKAKVVRQIVVQVEFFIKLCYNCDQFCDAYPLSAEKLIVECYALRCLFKP